MPSIPAEYHSLFTETVTALIESIFLSGSDFLYMYYDRRVRISDHQVTCHIIYSEGSLVLKPPRKLDGVCDHKHSSMNNY